MPVESSLTPQEVTAILNGTELTSPIATIFSSNHLPLSQAVSEMTPHALLPKIFFDIAGEIGEFYPDLTDPFSPTALLEIERETSDLHIPNHLVGKILAVTYASGGTTSPLGSLPKYWLSYNKLPPIIELSDLSFMQTRLVEIAIQKSLFDQLTNNNNRANISNEEFNQIAATLRAIVDEKSIMEYVQSLHNFPNPIARRLANFSDEFGNGISTLSTDVAEATRGLDPQSRLNFIKKQSRIANLGFKLGQQPNLPA